jgi:hypothetical protein
VIQQWIGEHPSPALRVASLLLGLAIPQSLLLRADAVIRQ